MEKNTILSIEHLYKSFLIENREVPVLEDINLEIQRGEFIAIVGFSGCGKSTLLRIISGLEQKNQGVVRVNSHEVNGPGLERSMIFQESRLFPWMKVKENILYGINEESKKKLGRKEADALVKRFVKLVNLEGFENAYPTQLSGGMQQRVSIARSLIANPDLLLLDEPFGALDAITRIGMQDETLRIWKENHTTMLLVTHDIDEAVYLSDRVIVMSQKPGRIKGIINVKLPRPRKRTSVEFSEVRRKVYKLFFEDYDNSDIDIDYVI